MGKIESFKDLIVWQKAVELAVMTYKLSECFPDHEKFGMMSQMRRAAVSISSNIAEGFGRKTAKDKIRFYTMAQGSNDELQSLIYVALRIKYLSDGDVSSIAIEIDDIKSLLHGLMKSAVSYSNT